LRVAATIDANRLIEILTGVTDWFCGSDRAALVGKRLRRSNKGNIVFESTPVLTKRFLEGLHADSSEDLEHFVECLKPEAAAELAAWAQAYGDGGNAPVREFGLDDFAARGLAEDKIALAMDNFLLAHRTYAGKMRGAAADLGAVELSGSLAQVTGCRPEAGTVALEVAQSKLAVVCRGACACGFAATVTGKTVTILPSVVTEHNRLLGALAAGQVLGRPDDPEAPAARIGWLQGQSEGIAAEYHLTPKALQAARELSAFAESVRNRKISYDGTWSIGPFRFDSLTPANVLEKVAKERYAIIEAGRITRKDEIGTRIREAWRTRIKPVCGDYGEIYAALPPTARLTKQVVKAYQNLSSLNAAWSSAKISVAGDGSLAVDGHVLKDIERDAATEAARLSAVFTASVARAGTRAGAYNQGVVRKIVELVAAHQGRMGATGVSQVLAGSKSQKILHNRLDRLPGYGSLAGVVSQQAIAGMVDMMTEDGLLTVGERGYYRHSMPVLRVSPEVVAAFRALPEVPLEQAPPKGRVVDQPATIQESVARRSWDTLAGMAEDGDWAAEVALNVAAALWPSGKAVKCLRASGREGGDPEQENRA
jgi:hypothetical protein